MPGEGFLGFFLSVGDSILVCALLIKAKSVVTQYRFILDAVGIVMVR